MPYIVKVSELCNIKCLVERIIENKRWQISHVIVDGFTPKPHRHQRWLCQLFLYQNPLTLSYVIWNEAPTNYTKQFNMKHLGQHCFSILNFKLSITMMNMASNSHPNFRQTKWKLGFPTVTTIGYTAYVGLSIRIVLKMFYISGAS